MVSSKSNLTTLQIFKPIALVYSLNKLIYACILSGFKNKKQNEQLYNTLLYLSIFLFDTLTNVIKFRPNKNVIDKDILFISKKTFNYWSNYFYYIIIYYKKYNYYLLNYKMFNYIFYSFLLALNTTAFHDYISVWGLDESIFKWISLGFWSICASVFIRKKYKEKITKFNNNYGAYNEGIYNWLKIYYKYNGNYKQYAYIKKFLILNKNINKKVLLTYDYKKNKFIKKCNIYYDLMMEESFMKNPKLNNNEYFIHLVFNSFLKNSLDTPFINDEIPFTYFYKKNNKKINRKQLRDLSYLISFAYLYKKKNVLSELTKEELHSNFSNFYKLTVENELKGVSILNCDYNEPYIVPPLVFSKFENKASFDLIFEDLEHYNIEDLMKLICQAFSVIKESELMFCENTDLNIEHEDIVINQDVYNNYNLSKNDLSLLIWLNKNALEDKNFGFFVKELKEKYTNISSTLLNINLFEEAYSTEHEMLNTFLKNNFFFLDYFTLAINSNKYSLCYLLFVYKVLKNVYNYNQYYKSYNKNVIKTYNKIIYKYHKHINNKLQNAMDVFNQFIKYKTNNVLDNQNKINIDFLWNIKTNKFKYYNKKNIKNIIKINKASDYQLFLTYFEKYKSIDNFKKVNLNTSTAMTFDNYVYGSLNIQDLRYSIINQKEKVNKLLKNYIYDKDNTLINFSDLGFYLYDIEGFEWAKQDTILFFDYRDSELLTFYSNDKQLNEKKIFQYNYSVLYFHYLIKSFKNLKHYEFSISLENLLFEDAKFYYPNFDISMDEKRVDFLFYLERFLKGFKLLTMHKHTHIVGFINNLILHYGRFTEFLEIFDFDLLYDPNIIKKCDSNELNLLEQQLDNIMQVWKHLIDKIDDMRKFYVESINLLRLDKLIDYLDFPMFNNSKGFLKLKESYLIKLEELICEERMLDHAFNITMCLFRTFDKHNNFFRQQVLFQNGCSTTIYGLLIHDWEFIFELEINNPLIIIEIYNSKQKFLKSELWHPSLSFRDIVYSLSNVSSKQIAYGTADDSWKVFFETYLNRNTIMYDLNELHIKKVRNFIELHNSIHYTQLDINENLCIFFDNNALRYDSSSASAFIIKKQDIRKKSAEVDLTISSIIEEETSNKKKFDYDALIFKNVNVKKKKKKYESESDNDNIEKILKNKNLSINDFKLKEEDKKSFTIFANILDATNEDIEISSKFILYLKEKISQLTDSAFKNYLYVLHYRVTSDYEMNAFEDLEKSVNYLYYLIKFFENIIKLDNFNNEKIKEVNDCILYNAFNYLEPNKIFNLNYVPIMFKNIKITDWSNSLSKCFDNKNLFAFLKGRNYLDNIFNLLNNFDNSNNLSYLSNLESYILTSNYNNNNKLIYNFDNALAYSTFHSLFDFLNMHILKINYMLNNLIYLKNLINDIYLNICTENINITNLHILSKLFVLLSVNRDNEFDNKYMNLINLLLYVKDPIYLYNILTTDIKCYISNLVKIFDVIQTPDFNNNVYNDFLNLLMFNNNKEDWNNPLKYKGWSFNIYSMEGHNTVTAENLQKLKMSNFFFEHNLTLLNNYISNLDHYSLHGYFNLNIFNGIFNVNEYVNELILITNNNYNILSLLNIDKLLLDFNSLFIINNKNALVFYNAKEFLVFNEDVDVNEAILKKKELYIFPYMVDSMADFLIYLNTQAYKYRFIFSSQYKVNNNIIKEEKNNIDFNIKKSKDMDVILYKKTLKLKKKGLLKKSISAPNILLGLKNFNTIKFTNSIDKQEQKDISLDLEEEAEAERLLKKAYLVSDVITEYRQWASDLEFNQAFIKCKQTFETTLMDFDHPLWADMKSFFVNKDHFLSYIKTLTTENIDGLFNNFWSDAIDEIQNEREEKKLKHSLSKWDQILQFVILKPEEQDKIRASKVIDLFRNNLEKNKKWKNKWNSEFYYLNDLYPYPKESNYKAAQYWDNIYNKKEVLGYKESIERGEYIADKNPKGSWNKKKHKKYLWNKLDWWKKW